MKIKVKTTPRSKVVRLDEPGSDGVWQARVQAPPVDGKANEALVKFFAGLFGVPKGAVSIVAGDTARLKRVRINGLAADKVSLALSAARP